MYPTLKARYGEAIDRVSLQPEWTCQNPVISHNGGRRAPQNVASNKRVGWEPQAPGKPSSLMIVSPITRAACPLTGHRFLVIPFNSGRAAPVGRGSKRLRNVIKHFFMCNPTSLALWPHGQQFLKYRRREKVAHKKQGEN